MASLTLTGLGDRYPEGTSLSVFRSDMQARNDGPPSGTAVATATVLGRQVTFTGLAENQTYWVVGQVGSVWRWTWARVQTDSVIGGAPLRVQDEGTDLPIRPRMRFNGTGVTAADDATNEATVVTVGGVPGPPGPNTFGVDVWASQGNPESVTDWGPIINTLIQNGARRLQFRRVSGVNTKYYVSTPIAPGLRQPILLEGEVGHTWQEWVNSTFVKPAVSLVWNGTNGESLLKRQNTQTLSVRDLGLEFANGYTGRLVRAAPDNGGAAADAAYGGVFERVYFGPENPGATNEDSAGCLVSLIRDVASRYRDCMFHGGQYAIRGTESTHSPSYSNDAEFIGCVWNAQAIAPFCNIGNNWRVIGGTFELTDPVGADTGADTLMDTDYNTTLSGNPCSLELLFPTFWDITNSAFTVFASKSGRPIAIKCVGGYINGAAKLSLLGGGSLDIDGLRATSSASDMTIDLGSATTDYKRVRLRNIELFQTRTVVWTNRDGHDVVMENVGSQNSRKASIRKAAIEVGGFSTSQAGNEPPTVGNFAANVTGGVAHSSSDGLFFVYLQTSAVIAAGTRVADVTFNVPLPYDRVAGHTSGPLPVPILQPIGANIPSVVNTNSVDSYAAGAVVESVPNDRTKFSIKLANGIGTGKTLGYVVSTKVLS